ncbi:uncharacterized protein LOC108100617 [Drosophila ficusphila]|uniref:uncharacterized protein LOC108100617 n=1 Tax=Drosophila ficusphila TaxID=30025 RepID=UPI0007E79723|nr:uncharacterized protein LOC108100617 [Drosophila ficusphila]XP_017060098.1 uncharacterized protein LOC108100617 [Drosophila ficusphila]XP_017060099.1 uncharacterized protein LOC108100617 [Drosophila ficusphila]XP_017060100.1 uncharacterized protein LOC108100617 [Drosophila ficusphila]XP_043063692.1 uncharacterized protein LOC108100617 [Drosophila ficusphila]
MIEIGLGLSTMWSALEFSGASSYNYQCSRLLQSPPRSTDKPLIPKVSLRYQPAVIPSFLLVGTVLTICLGSVLGAPQSSCIMCDKEDLRPRVPPYSDSYEEYTFDHQVSQQSAMEYLQKHNKIVITKSQHNACSSIKCPANASKYCRGTQFINDHCYCEQQHREEGLPYVPHVCFADQKEHTPSVDSCFEFVEIKECCCAEIWLKKWRHISGSSRSQHVLNILIPLLSTISVLNWISRSRIFC